MTAQRGVCEGEPAEVTTRSVTDLRVETGADGWMTDDGGWGVRGVPRAEAIARIATAPTRVLLEPTFALDECRSALSTHAYFQVPGSLGPQPFQAAVMVGEVLPWRNFEAPRGELYLAGVRVGTLHDPKASSCHGLMPPRDAAVVALVPVRNVAEGLRLLSRMP